MDGISGCFRAYFRDRSITFANSMVENMFVLMFNAFTRKVHLNQYVNYFKSLTLYSGQPSNPCKWVSSRSKPQNAIRPIRSNRVLRYIPVSMLVLEAGPKSGLRVGLRTWGGDWSVPQARVSCTVDTLPGDSISRQILP
jgi:hypothetical protein